MNRKLFKLILLFFLVTFLIQAEGFGDSVFKKAKYGKPLISEIHGQFNKAEIGYDRNYDEYNMDDESTAMDRPVVIVDVGFDIPIFAMDFGVDNSWGFTISLPMSMHILEDMFESKTAPLLDTDYRFGTPKVSFIKRFSKTGFIKNMTLTWFPMFHECTHLGDEIIIHRTDVNLPVIRANISYEYTELSLAINDPEDRKGNLHSFKIGGIYRISDNGYGWFSINEESEMQGDVDIEHSDNRFEYYFDYQFQRGEGFLAGKRAVNVFAIEARRRVRLGYPMFRSDGEGGWIVKDVKESMKWSFNVYLGYYFFPKEGEQEKIGMFIRFYQGVNPFGQMRNYPNYRFLGFSLTYNP
ncbi:hypothetical protein JXR93_04080 [bacterium]|nr:hypothetical protein [bacterium]